MCHTKSFDSNGAQHKRPERMNERVLARIKKSTFECLRHTRDGKDYLEYARARNAARTETRRAVRDYEHEIAKLAKKNP